MVQRSRQSTHQRITKEAWIRLHAAVVSGAESVYGYDRRRFAWGFLVSLSALSLTAYHPAIAHEAAPADWKPAPREPETTPSHVVTPRAYLDGLSRDTPVPRVRMAADEPPTETPKQPFDIPAGDLDTALIAFSRQSGLQIAASTELVAGLQSQGVQGDYTPEDALRRLLMDTGLEYRFSNPTSITLQRVSQGEAVTGEPFAAAAPISKPVKVPEIVVKEVIERPRFGDAPPEGDGFKADYQSSATKSPLSIKDTPQSITVITRDSMNARQVRDLTSALELSAGLVAGSSSTLGGPFAGRGLSTGETFNLRGQDLNENRDIRVDGFAVPASSFDMAAYERVEVVKGPSSMLYGQGSIGGFVNLIRKKPLEERAASFTTQIGSFDTYRGEADVTGPLDKNKRILGRLSAAYDTGRSFINGVETKVAMIAPSLSMKISERTRALLQLLYQDEKFVPSHGIPLRVDGDKLVIPNISRSLFVGVPSREKSTAENMMGSLRVDHEISDRWLATLMLQGNKQNFRRFFDSYAHGGIAPNGDTSLYSDTAHIETENWAGELRLTGRFNVLGREHQVMAGIEKNQRKQRVAFGYSYLGQANLYSANFASVPLIPGGAGSIPFGFDNQVTSNNHAAYGQVMFSVLDRTKLLAGARFDWADQRSLDRLTNVISSDKSSSALTFRFGLTQTVTENINAYASFAQSFNPVTAQSQGGQILDPERGAGYEVGVKTEWFQKRLAASVALFLQDLNNRPIPDPTNVNFSISGGKQRTQGVEVEVFGSPIPGLTIGVASAWLDGRFSDKQDPSYGLRPYGSVTRQSSLFASYELQETVLKGLGAGVMFVSIGDRFLGYPGATSYYGSNTDQLFIEGYNRLDLNMFYTGFAGWHLSMQIRNLTDNVYIERYRDVLSNNYFGSPRAVLFRASYSF